MAARKLQAVFKLLLLLPAPYLPPNYNAGIAESSQPPAQLPTGWKLSPCCSGRAGGGEKRDDAGVASSCPAPTQVWTDAKLWLHRLDLAHELYVANPCHKTFDLIIKRSKHFQLLCDQTEFKIDTYFNIILSFSFKYIYFYNF